MHDVPLPSAGVGIRLELSTRETSALVANLHRYDDTIVADLVALNLATSESIRALAYALAPVDQDFMRQQIKVAMSRDGLTFEVGYDDRDFVAAGQPPYYWWQELGFTHYITGELIRNPHLEPAHRQHAAPYHNAVRQRVQLAIRTLSVRG